MAARRRRRQPRKLLFFRLYGELSGNGGGAATALRQRGL